MQATFTSQQNNALTKQRKATTPEAAFENNRPAAVAQQKLGEAIQNSPKTAAQAKLVNSIQNSPKAMVQRKAITQLFGKDAPAQMMEEEDLLQGKFESNAAPVQKKAENGLPGDVNTKLESTLGMDFSGVNIHTNSNQATQMQALAYTQGNDVHFAPGQFKPNTASGQQLIGHEFAHVVQQAQGRVKPTTEVNGMPVNDNKGLEGEADRLGEKVARA